MTIVGVEESVAEGGESGVAECRYGVENGCECAIERVVAQCLVDECCADEFDSECDDDDIAQCGEYLRHAIVGVDEVFDKHLVLRWMTACKH